MLLRSTARLTVSSRTPEGDPYHCSVCGEIVVTDASDPLGDACCPQCGSLLLGIGDGLKVPTLRFDDQLSKLGDSLDVVELIMELEEHFDIEINEEQIMKFETVADLIRFIRQQRDINED